MALGEVDTQRRSIIKAIAITAAIILFVFVLRYIFILLTTASITITTNAENATLLVVPENTSIYTEEGEHLVKKDISQKANFRIKGGRHTLIITSTPENAHDTPSRTIKHLDVSARKSYTYDLPTQKVRQASAIDRAIGLRDAHIIGDNAYYIKDGLLAKQNLTNRTTTYLPETFDASLTNSENDEDTAINLGGFTPINIERFCAPRGSGFVLLINGKLYTISGTTTQQIQNNLLPFGTITERPVAIDEDFKCSDGGVVFGDQYLVNSNATRTINAYQSGGFSAIGANKDQSYVFYKSLSAFAFDHDHNDSSNHTNSLEESLNTTALWFPDGLDADSVDVDFGDITNVVAPIGKTQLASGANSTIYIYDNETSQSRKLITSPDNTGVLGIVGVKDGFIYTTKTAIWYHRMADDYTQLIASADDINNRTLGVSDDGSLAYFISSSVEYTSLGQGINKSTLYTVALP